ncbi:MAG: TolC family protein [Candidatus Thioglobus sp.]
MRGNKKNYSLILAYSLLCAGLCSFPVANARALSLPVPQKTKNKTKFMSLRDAIDLALRNNPLVLSAEMSQVTNKFELESAYDHFSPQIGAITVDTQYDQYGNSTTTLDSLSVTQKLHSGATITVKGLGATMDNITGITNLTENAQLTIEQPLLKGAGTEVNTNDLKSAQENAVINKLQYRDSISSVVTTVAKNYRALMQALNQDKLDQTSITQQQLNVKQQDILYKAGKKSYNDYLQIKQTLVDIQSSKTQNQLTLDSAYQALLTTLVLDPNSRINISSTPNMTKQNIPTKSQCLQLAEQNDATYRQAIITLAQAKRGVDIAKNGRLWTLGLTGKTTIGHEDAGQPTTSGINGSSVGLSLSVPINNIGADQHVTTEKISLINDRHAVHDAKTLLASKIKVFLQDIANLKLQIQQGESKIDIDQRALAGVKIKYRYGKVDVSDYTSQISTLRRDQTNLITQKISLLNEITDLRQYIGLTLKQWGISLR